MDIFTILTPRSSVTDMKITRSAISTAKAPSAIGPYNQAIMADQAGVSQTWRGSLVEIKFLTSPDFPLDTVHIRATWSGSRDDEFRAWRCRGAGATRHAEYREHS